MRLPDSWSKAPVTLGIALVTFAAFLIPQLLLIDEWFSVWGAFIPARLAFGDEGLDFAPFWLTPLTATLIHADWIHLGFNLLVLVFCGRPVEAVLGRASLAILYVVGAYAAAAAQYALDPSSAIPMVGASGAISAVIGAYAMLFGRNKVKIGNPRLALWLNALWLMAAWVLLQTAVGIALQGGALPSGATVAVAVGAHVGGFIAGVLLANPLLLFRYRKA
jgi:membrane associated rhomboid family serine protease